MTVVGAKRPRHGDGAGFARAGGRAALVRRVLDDCYCRLQASPIAGIGVFAVRDIPRGVNPFRLLRKYARPGYARITEEEMAALPDGLSALIRALFLPTDGVMHLPLCGTNLVYLSHYLNHSTRPNMRTRDGVTFTTARMIRRGEELTVDYRSYGAEGVLPRRHRGDI